MGTRSKTGICSDCDRTALIKARGMCVSCVLRHAENKDPSKREARLKASREYYWANHDKMIAYHRERNKNLTKEIRRKWHLKLKYDLSPEQYQEMVILQDNKCAICSKGPKGRLLVVDHNHETGKIRGLLCTRCNTVLSEYENEVWVEAATNYLQKYDDK